MSHAYAPADPGAYAPSDCHPTTAHDQCHCAHPPYSIPNHYIPFHYGETAAIEDIHRLTHRASFAESAFYAILHSNAPKNKDQATEANKIDRLIESVEALAQESLRLSQDASTSTITLSEKLDTSIQTITRSQESQELKLEESQDTIKELMESICSELQDSRTQLLEDVKSQIRAGAEESSSDDSWALRQMLTEREDQLIQAQEDLQIARMDHSNAEILSDLRKRELVALKNELASINEVQTSHTKKAKELELESKKASFAIRQMLQGRYTSDEWIEQAPKDLFPFDFSDELVSLGGKLSDALNPSSERVETFGLDEYPANSGNDYNSGQPLFSSATYPGAPPTSNYHPSNYGGSYFGHTGSTSGALPTLPWVGSTRPTLPSPSVTWATSQPVVPSTIGASAPLGSSQSFGASSTAQPIQGRTGIAVRHACPGAKKREDINNPYIKFLKGEIITNVVPGPGPWLGTNAAGQRGWFAQGKVELM